MEDQEKQYAKGFNSGYLIAVHEPDLYSTVAKGLQSKNEYLEGFLTGGKEYEIEKAAPTKATKVRTQNHNPNRDIER